MADNTKDLKDLNGLIEEVEEIKESGKKINTTPAKRKPVPKVSTSKKPIPTTGNPENTVTIGGELIEIKPTLVKYLRDRTVAFYRMIELYPLPDIFAMSEDAIGDEFRDGDKCIFDWLVAVTDNPELITEHYESIDIETIENILAIFKRITKIDEKEAKLKKHRQERGEMRA